MGFLQLLLLYCITIVYQIYNDITLHRKKIERNQGTSNSSKMCRSRMLRNIDTESYQVHQMPEPLLTKRRSIRGGREQARKPCHIVLAS